MHSGIHEEYGTRGDDYLDIGFLRLFQESRKYQTHPVTILLMKDIELIKTITKDDPLMSLPKIIAHPTVWHDGIGDCFLERAVGFEVFSQCRD
jgi:hypothetical protein